MRNPGENRALGLAFEDLFVRRAMINGFLPIKNHFTCRFTYKGKVQVIPGELDYTLITQTGRVGYYDCKCFGSAFFTFSQLDEHQVKRSVTYNHWKVSSGFVVWFRKSNQVVFYTGSAIEEKGPGSRFTPEDGSLLGRFEDFDLKLILAA